MGCGRAREEERPYRQRQIREGGGEDPAHSVAADGAAMVCAATPWEGGAGPPHLPEKPGEEDRVPGILWAAPLGGGAGCRRSRALGRRTGRECEFLAGRTPGRLVG